MAVYQCPKCGHGGHTNVSIETVKKYEQAGYKLLPFPCLECWKKFPTTEWIKL